MLTCRPRTPAWRSPIRCCSSPSDVAAVGDTVLLVTVSVPLLETPDAAPLLYGETSKLDGHVCTHRHHSVMLISIYR